MLDLMVGQPNKVVQIELGYWWWSSGQHARSEDPSLHPREVYNFECVKCPKRLKFNEREAGNGLFFN